MPVHAPTHAPTRNPASVPSVWNWNSGPAFDAILDSMQTETDGLVIDFLNNRTLVRTASVDSASTPLSLLTYNAPSPKRIVGSNGYLKPAAFNLQQYSEDFSNAAWTKTRCTATAGALIESAGAITGSFLKGYSPPGALSHVASVEAKEVSGGAKRYLIIGFRYDSGNTRWGYAIVNLADQTYNTAFDGIQTISGTVTVTSAGDGWYRVQFYTSSPLAGMQFVVGTCDQANPTITTQDPPSYTGDGVSGMLLRKAQITSGTDLVDYISTTSAARYAMPIEYNSSGVCIGARLEWARTNMMLDSNTFSSGNWGAVSVSVAQNVTGPDGVANSAWTLTAGATGACVLRQGGTCTIGQQYVSSIIAKAGNTNYVSLTTSATVFGSDYAVFNLSNGTIDTAPAGSFKAGIIALGNGWYLCYLVTSAAVSASSTTQLVVVTPSRSGAARTAAVSGDTVLIADAQFEAGLTVSSRIRTGGSTVTRAIDDLSLATSAFPWSATALSLIMRVHDYNTYDTGATSAYAAFTLGGARANFARTDSGSYDRSAVFDGYNGTNFFTHAGDAAGATGTLTNGLINKFGYCFESLADALFANGSLITSAAQVAMVAADTLNIGSNKDGGGFTDSLNAHLQVLKFIPRRATNAQMIADTTP